MLDPVKNWGKVSVDGLYNQSATIVNLASGDGAKLPDPSTEGEFNLIWFNSTDFSDPADDPSKEIVRCTVRNGDQLTVVRPDSGNNYNGEGDNNVASAKDIAGKDYKMFLGVTKRTVDNLLESIYPVGSVYINATNSTNPATLLGFGTWQAWGIGRAIVGIDTSQTEFDTAGKTGGEKKHTLTAGEMPRHRHRADPGQANTSSAGNHNHATNLHNTLGVWSSGGLFSNESNGFGHGSQYGANGRIGGNVWSGHNGNHNHTVNLPAFDTDQRGSSQSHNNLQPYQVGYVWRRTA